VPTLRTSGGLDGFLSALQRQDTTKTLFVTFRAEEFTLPKLLLISGIIAVNITRIRSVAR
jgi:hypothetical protein